AKGRAAVQESTGGMRAEDYESIGTTYDGVRVLAPKTKSTNFTTEEIREAVKKAIAEDAGRTALNPPAREGEGDQP
ncbi:hypothetical protein AB2C45_34145, partial [Pseudomonas aeruginosa]|uniref:hypothetical protein n=1 Tax=Klebsiella pneumoniae TaxID=573 RepID=UPI0034E182C1